MTYVLEATVSVTIDVIGGEPGTIKRVEGRRRDKHGPEESSIQVLGDNGSKAHPTKSLQQPGPQQPLVPPTGPPPSVCHPQLPFQVCFLHLMLHHHPFRFQHMFVPPATAEQWHSDCQFMSCQEQNPWDDLWLFPVVCKECGDALEEASETAEKYSSHNVSCQSASYSNSQPPPFGYNSTAMMKGIITIAEKAATILSRTITVEIIVGSENIIIGSKGTETKRKQANTNHGVSSMRAKNVKATSITSTRRTSTRRKKS
ncbi:uncharacterized protein LOC114589107 isoform X2 [Podarcis muralis]